MKTVSLMFLLLVIPCLAIAEFPAIKITNFDVSYTDPSGSGTATSFETPNEYVTLKDKSFDILFIKKDGTFIFTYGSNEFLLESPPTMLLDANNFDWSNFNLISGGNKINLSLDSLNYQSTTESGLLRSLKIDCTENGSNDDELGVKLLDSCLKQSKISLQQMRTVTNATLVNFIPKVVFNEEAQETTEIKNLILNVANHTFALKVTAKLDITATLKANGKVWYLKDENKIKIQLDKAKVGFFSVKGKIFAEFEKDTSGKIVVQRPYIYMDLNE